MNKPTDNLLKGVLRNLKTGTYHRGSGNAPGCNHSGSMRIPRCVTANANDAERASESSFCRKCFPQGKPDISTMPRAGSDV